jgi:hypothetical protein
MGHTFPENIRGTEHQIIRQKAGSRAVGGSGKPLATTQGKPRNSVLSLVKVQAGFNVRVFTHNRRLVFLVMHARPDHVRMATHQVYDAVKTGKTCLISSSKGYKCLLLNLHASLLSTILAGIFCTSNPEIVRKIVMMVFNIN